ncbi:MAG: tetratricopeptide repeat protein, partial [Planctomycetaceae bacterium]|nr:tetratricopeptide repeat protein [Planctomycetaceae bacterium]
MKIRFLAAASCLAICTGCQTADLLTNRLGHGRDKQLSQLAENSDSSRSDSPQLPPPTNRDPRPATEFPNAVDEHMRLGEVALRGGQLAQAQRHFEQALIARPDHAKANHRMAVVCDKLAQYTRAEQHYQIALSQDPRNVAVLSDLGYSYWLQERYSEGERYLLEARSIDPNYETAIANLGMLYGTTGRTDAAMALFRQIGDDAQVQQIMQQVNELAARRKTPAGFPGGPTPTATAQTWPTPTSNAIDATPDRNGVNSPTRELLDLMERGRKQQQRDHQIQQAGWIDSGPAPVDSTTPPANSRRGEMSQPQQQAQANWTNSAPVQHPAARPGGVAPVPTHRLNEALAEVDRTGRPRNNGPIAIGPAVPQQQTWANEWTSPTTPSYASAPPATGATWPPDSAA